MRRWRSFKSCSLCIHGKACHTILRSLCFLTNRVPLPPLCRGQNKTPRDSLLINSPLEMTVLADTPIVISTEAKRRNLLPPMVHEAWRREISRLRVSSKRFPSAPYRHAAPLEMTMVASASLVISTEAKRSGEISRPQMTEKPACALPSFRPKRSGVEKSPPSDSTGDITVEDLSTQSIMGAFPICPIPTRSPARDDGVGEHPSRHFDRSEAEWRNLLSLMVHEAWRPKISGLRVPIEPCIPARAPLEMTRGSP